MRERGNSTPIDETEKGENENPLEKAMATAKELSEALNEAWKNTDNPGLRAKIKDELDFYLDVAKYARSTYKHVQEEPSTEMPEIDKILFKNAVEMLNWQSVAVKKFLDSLGSPAREMAA